MIDSEFRNASACRLDVSRVSHGQFVEPATDPRYGPVVFQTVKPA
jgi:hypothetical protein